MATEVRLSAAARMMALFDGYRDAHGTHGGTNRSDAKGGKLEIKKTARTIREPVTEERWREHLSGTRPIGIIPIKEDHTCAWGCIDVDKYDLNHGEIVKKLKDMGLPLIVCRSKSGGAHIYLFLMEPEPAEEMRAVLQQLAASLGWGDCEVFPKQSQIIMDRGDLGNWLNMPYLGGDSTDRYAFKDTGMGMTLHEFLTAAEGMRTELSMVKIKKTRGGSKKDMPNLAGYEDAPPCLQHLVSMGFPEGGRNTGLFAMGVYLKRKYESDWKERVEHVNRESISPPLSSEEVAGILRSLDRKDYSYTCKDVPLKNFCNSSLCRTRKYGVGGGGMFPVVTGLSKLETEPPVWFLDIEDHRIELNTRQLLNYKEFQIACADKITVMFMNMKAETWAEMIGAAMTTANIIEAPVESSTNGHFMELLEEFCTNRHSAQNKDEIVLGKPWLDEETERHYFRLRDLMNHLETKKFTVWGRNVVSARLDEIGGRHFFNIKKVGVNTFWVPATFSEQPNLPLPAIERSPV